MQCHVYDRNRLKMIRGRSSFPKLYMLCNKTGHDGVGDNTAVSGAHGRSHGKVCVTYMYNRFSHSKFSTYIMPVSACSATVHMI